MDKMEFGLDPIKPEHSERRRVEETKILQAIKMIWHYASKRRKLFGMTIVVCQR